MRHFVLTRSAYGPAWTLDANRRRLDVTRAVTARLMAAQTSRNWAWIVLLDERDPLYAERAAVYAAASPTFIALPWTAPGNPKAAPWDRNGTSATTVQRIAASAYKAPWREAIGPREDTVMMTRLDDDDGLAVDAIERYQRAARRVGPKRTILMLPSGVRVWRGMYADVRHLRNAMHTLVTPPGDGGCVYDYGHAKCERAAPIVMVDQAWGWLWVRHRDTISGWRKAERPISSAVRAAFPVDWKALKESWS
jgi:hypothetical protein